MTQAANIIDLLKKKQDWSDQHNEDISGDIFTCLCLLLVYQLGIRKEAFHKKKILQGATIWDAISEKTHCTVIIVIMKE